MQTYLVGGAVRDMLLGEKPREHDYVVVGSTPKQMLKQGFKQVGKDFPVFLHPKTHEEYALARTERKSGVGYHGFTTNFSPEVTLEEDLIRRDLTINAMAQDQDGNIIDPYHGQQDLREKRLKHVSDAFVEDPLRVLRVARFQAKLPEFTIAPKTLSLMQTICEQPGEISSLSHERIWLEINKASHFERFDLFWKTLHDSNCLKALNLNLDINQLQDSLNSTHLQTIWRLVACLWKQPSECLDTFNALSPPSEIRQSIQLIKAHHKTVEHTKDNTAEAILRVVQNIDPFRRPERAQNLLESMRAISEETHQFWSKVVEAMIAVDTRKIAKDSDQSEIASAIQKARITSIKHLL